MRENVKILVVCLDPGLRDIIIDVLEFSVNRKVMSAADDRQALDHLDMQGPADIILCDPVLPRMSGRDLIAAAKAKAPRCIGVLMAPPPANPGTPQDQIVNAYLERPADPQALFDIVQRFVVDG
jgi:DNA-binding NtrC family response regulator